MFSFIKVAALFRTAAASLSAKDYTGAANTAADVFELLGAADTAATIRNEAAAVGEGDARSIAVHALQIVADAIKAVFGFELRIAVSATPGGAEEGQLAAKCEALAECCEREGDAPKAMAAGPDATGAISPELLAVLIQGAIQVLQALFKRRFGG
jgi:hypothetical protein